MACEVTIVHCTSPLKSWAIETSLLPALSRNCLSIDYIALFQLSVGDLRNEGTMEPLGNWITTITPDEWREILEVYQVKEPAIPQGIPSNDH